MKLKSLLKEVSGKDYIDADDVLKIPNINGWKPEQDRMSGTIEWHKPGKESMFMASPNWADDGVTPVDLFDAKKDDYVTGLAKIDVRPYKGELKKQLKIYISTLKGIFSKLNVI